MAREGSLADGATTHVNDTAKRRQGRPKIISDFIEEYFYKPYVYSNSVKTRRGHLNEHYRFHALAALIEGSETVVRSDVTSSDFEFKWLYDENALAQKHSRGYRKTILTELGRLQDPRLIRDVARKLCTLQPKTKDAIALIRRYRLRQASDHQLSQCKDVQLAKELIDAVMSYLRRYPGTPFSDIDTALNYVRTLVRTAQELPD